MQVKNPQFFALSKLADDYFYMGSQILKNRLTLPTENKGIAQCGSTWMHSNAVLKNIPTYTEQRNGIPPWPAPGRLGGLSVGTEGLAQSARPVSRRPDVHAEEVLLGRGGQGERVPLQRRDGRALDQDVLTGRHGEAALPHAQLQDAGRVADHLDRGEGLLVGLFAQIA